MILAGPPEVCLSTKQVSGWRSQHGTALHPPTPWLPRDWSQRSCSWLLFGVQHHHPRSPLLQTLPSHRSYHHLPVDHQLPDKQGTAGEAGGSHLWCTDSWLWCFSGMLFSLYISDCTFKDPAVKLLKFEEDTTVIGLVQDSSAYGLEVEQLVLWCTHNKKGLQGMYFLQQVRK